MLQMTPAQIEIALRNTPQKPVQSSNFVYDPAIYDELLCGMFGRRWNLEEEIFPPHTTGIWSALFSSILGGAPRLEAIPLLLGVVKSTRSDTLRIRAVAGLRNYLADCSGVGDPTLKSMVREALETLDIPITQTKPVPKD